MQKSYSNRFFYYFIYTLLFVILSGVTVHIFRQNEVSFVKYLDGYAQHLPVLTYIGEYFRTFFSNIIYNHQVSLPMVDYTIGQGIDIISTLNYYGMGDPLTLLSVFFNENNVEYLYTFLIFFRMYLSGITFSIYCRYLNKINSTIFNNSYAVLCGALIYVFSGNALYASVRHPFFINGMIFLPLMLMGVEKIFNEKKPYLLSFVTALSLVSNFYFAYMNTALMGIYFLIKIFVCTEKSNIKSKFTDNIKNILSAAGAYISGIMMSAAIFFPVVYAFLNNARTKDSANGTSSMLVYGIDYYKKLIGSFIIPECNIDFWTTLSFSALCVPAVILLFVMKEDKKDALIQKRLRIGIIILTICLCVPLCGKLFNGMGYVSNRWVYGYAMLIGLITAYAIPKLLKMRKRELVLVTLISSLYLCAVVVLARFCDEVTSEVSHEAILKGAKYFLITVLVLATINVLRKYIGKNLEKICEIAEPIYKVLRKWDFAGLIVIILVVINLAANIKMIYSPEYEDYISEFVGTGTAMDDIKSIPIQAASEIEDKDFYRVEQPWAIGNGAIVLGINSNTYYYSVVPASVSNYFQELGMNTLQRQFLFRGLDGRTLLNTLASTKYFSMEKDGKYNIIPFGYKYLKDVTAKDGTVDSIYINKNYISLGYTYDSYMTKEEYNKLNAVEKQEALMQCAVIDENDIEQLSGIKKLNKTDIDISSREVECEITDKDNVEVKDNIINVTKKKAQLSISFKGLKNSETYIFFKGFKCNLNEKHLSTQKIKVESDKTANYLAILEKRDAAYFERDIYTVNLGYSEQGQTSCVITFPEKCEFSIEDFGIICLPMDNYEKQADNLIKDKLENLNVSGNYITGDIELKSDKLLEINVPYSKGWKAYVDGKEVEVIQSDTAYMSLKLDAGKHDIVMKYSTPFLGVGVIFMLLGVVSCFCLKLRA